jgi:PAS domain S-box-containing protein
MSTEIEELLACDELTLLRERIALLERENRRLRETRTFLHQLFQLAPAAIFVKDLQGRYLMANDHTTSLVNFTPKQIIGKTDAELLTAEIAKKRNVSDLQVIVTHKPLQIEETVTFQGTPRTYLLLKFPLYDEAKALTAVGTIALDFTERKKATDSLSESTAQLQARLNSILTPDAEVNELNLVDLIDLESLQQIQDSFAEIAGVASLITDPQGKPITQPSNFSDVCNLTRQTALGLERCIESDKILGAKAQKLMIPTYEKCLSCGFTDASAPIIVANKHVANWLIGQRDILGTGREGIAVYAQEIGVNVAEITAAYDTTPTISLKKFEQALHFLWQLAHKLSTLGYRNLQLTHENAERQQIEANLRQSEERLAHVLQQMPVMVLAIDEAGQIALWNKECEAITGYKGAEVATLKKAIKLLYPNQEYYEQIATSWLVAQSPYQNWERDIVCRDGSIKTIAWSNISALSPVPGWAGWLIGIDVTSRTQTECELRAFYSLVEHAPDAIGIAQIDGTLTYANQAYRNLTGLGDNLIGKNFSEHYPIEEKANAKWLCQEILTQGAWTGQLIWQNQGQQPFPVHGTTFLLYEQKSHTKMLAGIFRDLSSQQKAEAERQALQQQVFDAQLLAFRELSTPLIPLANNVLALPLIGKIDPIRMQQTTEVLLAGISKHKAKLVILDITGVPGVDAQVADGLVQAAKMVKLLGAQIILTGVGPSMAQTLTQLNADLRQIITRSTIQSGIAYALSKSRALHCF